MTLVLSAQEMRAVDAAQRERDGDIPLMRAAGEALARVIPHYARYNHVIAFAGPGNNGGDAFAACAGLDPTFERVVYAAPAESVSDARRDAESRARASGARILPLPTTREALDDALNDAGLAVDALFGTGARLPAEAPYAMVIEALRAFHGPVLAVDIPSGVDADSGAITEPAVRATVTVALGALKPGLLLDPGREFAGELWCADIGLSPEAIATLKPQYAALDNHSFLKLLPRRAPTADKRTAGAPLIVAGSHQFPGAAVLCARAAARAGAGYVTVATPSSASATLRGHLLEQVVVDIREDCSADEALTDLLALENHCSALAIGPGLPLDDRTGEIVRGLVAKTSLPFVADAGALFHFSKQLDGLRGKRCVLTPHAGEFARLSGKGTLEESERMPRLREFVDRSGITTLLKGHTTLIYDGTLMHFNTTGTATLATAGTGDVLTGIIATLLAQGLEPVDAARAGAYWHGLAGVWAHASRSLGVVASDLPELLSSAIPRKSDDELVARVF